MVQQNAMTCVAVVLREKQHAFPPLWDVAARIEDYLDYSVHWSILLAVQEGFLHLLHRLAAKNQEICPEKLGIAMQTAAKKGDLAILQWLHHYLPHVRVSKAVMDKAAEKGHLEIVEWLHSIDGAALGCSEKAIENAAMNGHLEMVKWLYVHQREVSSASRNTMQLAARGGHVSILRFLDDHQNDGCKRTVAMRAAEYGRIPVLQYMKQTHPDEFYTNELLAIARRCKKPDVVAWLSAK